MQDMLTTVGDFKIVKIKQKGGCFGGSAFKELIIGNKVRK